MSFFKWIVSFIICWVFLSSTIAMAQSQELSIQTLKDPIPVKSHHHWLLVYELHLVNASNNLVRVSRIEVQDEQQHHLASYSGYELLQNSLIYKNHKHITSQAIDLEKGMGAFIYIWIELDKHHSIPRSLQHKLWLVNVSADKSFAKVKIASYGVLVSQEKPVVIGPPLRGSNWIAEAAPSPFSYHRRTILPIENHFYLAQRFAVDWVQACPDGKEVHGNMHQNSHWNAFGHEVLAVYDGKVTQVQDKVPENKPPGLPNPPPNEKAIPGNYVIVNIKQHHKNYYVLYAHMQPGSIKVKLGDKITRGQVIGLLGNTGNSAAPHLHLHVSDANYPLKSEGVPFVFDQTILAGKAQEVDMDYGIWTPLEKKKTVKVSSIIPVANEIFDFSHEAAKTCH